MIIALAQAGAATGSRYNLAPQIVTGPASAEATELVLSRAWEYWRLTSM